MKEVIATFRPFTVLLSELLHIAEEFARSAREAVNGTEPEVVIKWLKNDGYQLKFRMDQTVYNKVFAPRDFAGTLQARGAIIS